MAVDVAKSPKILVHCSKTNDLLTCSRSRTMDINAAKQIYILGVTKAGKPFRPSDWAERLAGVMSQFRPGGPQPGSHLGYSPWCIPTSFGDVKCIIVHRDMRDYDVMAWDFCVNFARDNDLQVSLSAPEPSAPRVS